MNAQKSRAHNQLEGVDHVSRYNHALSGLAIAACLAAGCLGTALAGEELRPRQDKVSMGEEEVKRLLLVMADEKGEASEQAFMKYMQEEFSKLNKDERGQVNGPRPPKHKRRYSSVRPAIQLPLTF
jgi:hypothetical protein